MLHELAHDSLTELGRRLRSGIDEERFSSPAMHTMTGEAGDTIERHFFGSAVDAIGCYVDNSQTIFKIDHVVLRERRDKPLIRTTYFQGFLQIDFLTIQAIQKPDTCYLSMSSKSIKRKRGSSPIRKTYGIVYERNSLNELGIE